MATRLSEKRQIHLAIFIFLFISVRGDNPFELPSTCTPTKNTTHGGRPEIRYSFIGNFENSDILVYKSESRVKIVHSYLRDGKRQCVTKPCYNFSLTTNNKERTDCFLFIGCDIEQTADVYVFQTLNPSKRCKPCSLQADEPGVNTQTASPVGGHSTDKEYEPGVISQTASPVGGHSPDKESPNQTGSNHTSTLPTGAIAGIVVGALTGFAVAVAAVVVVKMCKQTCCRKRGGEADIPPTTGDGVTSSEKGGQEPCISTTTKGDDTSSESSQGSTTPLMNDKIPTV